MTKVMRDVQIKAPVEKVFDLLQDPKNLPELWPNMLEVKNVKDSTLGGFDYTWVYRMSEMQFDVKSQIIEFLTNRRIVMKSEKEIESTIVWDFFGDGEEEMHLMVEMDYEVPATLLKDHAEDAIVEENEHDIETMLQNIKHTVESEIVHA
jgi:uncharacterized membrane protein